MYNESAGNIASLTSELHATTEASLLSTGMKKMLTAVLKHLIGRNTHPSTCIEFAK